MAMFGRTDPKMPARDNIRNKAQRFQRQTWPWRTRRAVAFSVISMCYLDHLRNKVHFDPESSFRETAH